jgi:hypothetical protein
MTKRSIYRNFTPATIENEPKALIPPALALTDLPPSKLLQTLGVTPAYVLNEFMKIVNQDEDLSNKLKAIKPLVKEIGIDVDGTLPQGITNNIIVMPAEITKKFGLSSNIIEGEVIPPPPTPDTPETVTSTP